MILMVLAGLWALAFGGITITGNLRLEGRRARLYGTTLLGVGFLLFLLGPLLQRATPSMILANDAARIALNTLITGALIVGLVFPFRARAGER
jgi:hypothetical protein